MFKYLMLVLATASLTLTACGKDSKKDDKSDGGNQGGRVFNKGAYPNVAQTIFGQWKGPDEMDNGMLIRQSLYWNQTSMGVEIICERGREQVVASFSVNANVVNSEIQILEGATRTVKQGNITCGASIVPTRIFYRINGNSVTLYDRDGNKGELNLTRIL